MNKILAVLVIVLAAAVLLLSGALLYSSRTLCTTRARPAFQPGNMPGQQMPFQQDQFRSGQGNPPPLFNAGGQPGFMGGGQQGPMPQNMPGMGAGMQQQNRPGTQGAGGQQGFNQQPGQTPGPTPNESTGLREQVPKLMQESVREAQDYFRGQNHRPERQEMLAKVKELMTQKMTAQGISSEVQQQVIGRMDQAGPQPQPGQQDMKAQ